MSTLASRPVDIAEFWMKIPYGSWIPMQEAAQRLREVGLSGEVLTAAVRKGRRRSVLRTKARPEGTYVMRVREVQPTPAHAS
ncbi:hypothetical protein [Streptomyces cahuitamycinicus]|uniref:Uncharacterized protein n=1 Tax=Streptomyces cahuitamycinicus TaxID=2070367 RepID=A0A2N8TK95_9ACTN|nr:hypothetical protein [Streptomyces cahuitamycinicus]PNG19423.1 hypothetical protein C1J00_25690 [Streptomyces cahuitamycinicus]